jgi:hypothetical protein
VKKIQPVREIIEELVTAAERKLAELANGGPKIPAVPVC